MNDKMGYNIKRQSLLSLKSFLDSLQDIRKLSLCSAQCTEKSSTDNASSLDVAFHAPRDAATFAPTQA
ncbi:hypothetical protein OIU74_005935 [Salix koriyanagi]|uniref:Uncharacterized protein n=1 Tax=Salix koriyanagi TaxID=2511006 RepID=A0A9Q0UD92_9ROSI|nr:hypothetical protein OIU74_005935 [Salix koriyanagi]